jgi:hypothetical protein
MKARTFQRLVLITSLIAVAGCGGQQPAAKEACLPSAPAQPFVFYDPTGNPSETMPALSESELREITAWVAAQTSRPIWFIRVQPVLFEAGKRRYVTAYLAPDEAAPRMRVGDMLGVPEKGATPPLSKNETMAPPWKYVQVSLPNQFFTDQLTKPSVINLPFDWWQFALRDTEKDPDPEKDGPVPVSELVGIVDFVREPSSFKDLALYPRPEPPIRSIFRTDNGIEVAFGFVGGASITLERTPTGYKVKHSGAWMY